MYTCIELKFVERKGNIVKGSLEQQKYFTHYNVVFNQQGRGGGLDMFKLWPAIASHGLSSSSPHYNSLVVDSQLNEGT